MGNFVGIGQGQTLRYPHKKEIKNNDLVIKTIG
jgi:hypothetical protein